MTRDPLAWIDAKLDRLARHGLRRATSRRDGPQGPVVLADGRKLVNFGSNDYLGLAADGRLVNATCAALHQAGCGAGASPLVTGRDSWHERLERRLAEFESTEAALIFPSGYAANLGAISALVGRGDAVYCDAKNHASIHDGCRLSGADVHLYRHADVAHLAELFQGQTSPQPPAAAYRRRLIVTDTLFSMDGDIAPLAELAELARRHEAMLMVDEAHATGVFGPGGRGLVAECGLEDVVDVRVGTLSKAFGSAGGFVAGRRTLIEWLVNRARPYVYSTAPPAAVCAAACAALAAVEDEPGRGRELLRRAAELRQRLAAQGWDTGRSTSQIVPIRVGSPARAMRLAARLREAGLLVPGIRPPTVPRGEALLRVSLCWGHTESMVERLAAELAAARG